MRHYAAVAATLLLAACNSASTTAVAPAPQPGSSPNGVTPSTFSLPSGSGCAGEVARFQAIMDNDLATGHTTKSVHDRVSGEIGQARSTCAAGNESAAISQIAATKSRYGYR